jgi:hypothetical protein
MLFTQIGSSKTGKIKRNKQLQFGADLAKYPLGYRGE